MSKNTIPAELEAKLVAARLDEGLPWKQVFAMARAEGVASHTTVELTIMREEMRRDPESHPAIVWSDDADLAKQVKELRDANVGWGWIMVRSGLSEGKVRAAFTAATNLESRGQRTNKGGRFAYDDGELYSTETWKNEGFDIEKGAGHPARETILERKLTLLPWDDAKELAKKLGIRVTAKSTPVSLARAIAKAQAEKANA